MNFFTKTKMLIAVIIILSAIILAIFGTMGYHHFKMVKKENIEFRNNQQPGKFMARQLQLTDDQIKEFDSLRENFRTETNALIKDSRDISRDIMEEIMSDNPDINKLKTLAEKYGKLQEQEKQLMIEHLLDVKGKCTPSQQANFKKLIKQLESHDRMSRERHRNRAGKEKE